MRYWVHQTAYYDGAKGDMIIINYEGFADINEAYREMEKVVKYWKSDPKAKWQFEVRDSK